MSESIPRLAGPSSVHYVGQKGIGHFARAELFRLKTGEPLTNQP
jgi:hypothetical protein